MKRQRFVFLILAVILLAIVSAPAVFADGSEDPEVIYDASDFENLSGRTKQEVMQKYTDAQAEGITYISGSSASYYDTPCSLQAPYASGVLSADTLQAMQGMTNFYRWLIGVEPLTVNSASDASLQAQALDRNFEFNHHISNDSKPEDMDDSLWAEGFNCSHNILAMGYDPSGAVTGWLNEGYSISSGTWDTVGHRTSILTADYKNISYGYSGYVAIGKCGSYGSAFSNAFAAFPAPGYMPSDLIYRFGSSWTVQLNTAIIRASSPEDVIVTVENVSTGESYVCTKANGSLQVSSSLLNFVQPSDAAGSRYTDPYKVTVTGLQDTATGKSAGITYTVDFFELKQISYVSIPGTNYAYTGSGIRPEVTVTGNGTTLTEGTDYQVSYYNNVEEGTAIAEVKGIGAYCGTCKKAFTIQIDRKDISQYDVSLSPSQPSYTGSELKPAVTVSRFGTELTEGTDYECTYNSNVYPGTASVTVRGIGEYSGSVTRTFEITKAYQSISVSFSSYDLEVGGTASITASAAAGGAITFSSSDESVATVDPDGTIHALSEGTASITIQAAETEYYRSGLTVRTISVSYENHTMVDVDVIFADADHDTATITRRCAVCGKEETVSFTTMRSFSLWYWTGNQGSSYIAREVLEGERHDVSLRSIAPSDAEDQSLVLESSDPAVMKVNGLAFEFVGAGNVTLTVCAKYRPSVKITHTFNVSHVFDDGKEIKAATCSEKGQVEYTCTLCGAMEIRETVLDPANHSGGTHLANQLEPTCGSEGYTGDQCCDGCNAVLSSGSVIPATGAHVYDAGTVTREPNCSEEGIRLFTCMNCDAAYTEAIPKNDAHVYGEWVITTPPACTEPGIQTMTCTICGNALTEPVPAAGHVAGAPARENLVEPTYESEGSCDEVIRCKNCGMELSRTFTTIPMLTRQDIGEAVISIAAQTYTGQALTPEVTVTLDGRTLEAGLHYEVTYSNNKNAGTAAVTVTGTGDYTGTAAASFKINPKKVTPVITLSKTSYVYDGKAKKPSVTVKAGTKTLTTASYTVTYASGRIHAGTYKVTVTLKGNYSGTGSKTFTITKAAQPMTVKAKTASVAYSKVKVKAQALTVSQTMTIENAKGTRTYKKVSGSRYLSISSTTGKITVKKAAPKGTYSIKVTVTAAGTKDYKKGSKTVTVKVRVR